MSNKILFIGLALVLPISSALAQSRTVTDKEAASWFETPSFPWYDLGAYIGSPQGTLAGDVIRGTMGHFDKFYPAEDGLATGFPYAKLRAYEVQQVAAGQPPIFITATYAGKSRPVYWGWSLFLVNNQPTVTPDQWQYAVNVGDPRFIHFWINQYMEPLMKTYQVWPSSGPSPYLWFQLDQCAFEYSLFGVLDDNGNYVAGVPWDAPFPGNQAAYEAGIETFFSQVKALAPNVNLAANIGSQADPTHFPQLFANVSGGLTENIYGWQAAPTAYTRNSWYTQTFQYFPWLASQGRMAVTRADLPPGDPNALLASFVVYSLIKGPNFFFAPGGSTNGINPAPSTWAGMRAQLGSPLSGIIASAAAPAGNGYRLFSREFEGGTVYLNWTGTTQTIALNTGLSYYDPNGNAIPSHQIQLADASATYVTTNPQALSAPLISPRAPFSYVGPISVTMTSDTTGASIHYTLDGSTPTASSPLYTGPVKLTSSAVVNAKAFLNSQSSYQNSASYTVASSPTAEFLLSSDSGPSGSYYPVMTLSAIPAGPVVVKYSVTNGSPASGSYTFIPGIPYGILPLTTNSSGTMTVTLTSVTGAARGANQTMQYTVTNPVASADFSLAMTPASQSVAVGGSTSYTVTVTPLNGFSGAVNFGVSGLPSGVTGSFSPSSVTGSGSTTLTVKVPTGTASGSSTLSITATSGSLSHGGPATLSVQGAPNYSVAVSPASQTVAPGSGNSYTVTVTPVNGFTGVVNFGVSGLPSGVTGSFSPSSVTGSGSTILTIKTTTSATLGSSTVGVTGTSGSITAGGSATLSVQAAPNYSVAVSPASRTVTVGSGTSYTVTVTPLNGFTGVVNFGVSGLPSGVTGSFTPTSVTGSGSTTLTIKATTSATLGSSTVGVTGTSGSITAGGSAMLSVQAAPDYSLSVSQSSQTVVAGNSISYTVTVAPLNGFTGVVNFGVSGLPSGVTGTFSPTSVTGSGSTTLIINTTTAATIGSSTLSVIGTSGSLSHSGSPTLNVQAAPNYSMAVTPPSQTVSAGGSMAYTVTVTPVNGFTGAVNFGVSGLPSGATGTFSPSSVTGSGSTTLMVKTTAAATLGSSTLSVTANCGSMSHGGSATLMVQAAPDYSLAVSPSSQTVVAGSSSSYTVTVTPLNGFTGVVNFGVSGLPSGVTGTFNPTSVTKSGSTTLTINTTASATIGGATVTVTGTSGSLSHGGFGSLMVNGSGPSAVSVSPSSGSGLSQVFSFQFSDPQGYNNLSLLWFGYSSSTFAAHGCKVQYAPRAKTLYLEDDTNTTLLGPVTLGVAGTVSNSQCTLNAGTSSASGSGNTLTVNLALTFKSAFAGMQTAYMYAVDLSGSKTPAWQNRGTWIVP